MMVPSLQNDLQLKQFTNYINRLINKRINFND